MRGRGGASEAAVPAAIAVVVAAVLVVGAGAIGSAQTTGPTPVPSPVPTASAGAGGAGALTVYLRDCAWCHGNAGQGTGYGPGLQGVGAASADFMLSTGRMPIARPDQVAVRKAPSYTAAMRRELTALVASFGAGPAVPEVNLSRGNVPDGADLYELNCAACHSSTGGGGALTNGLVAPGFRGSTPTQIAEAIRLGGAGLRTGNMPRFGPGALSDDQVASLILYVLYLQHPDDRGGFSLGRIGPVAEGFAAWLGALLVLLLFVRWIGEKTS